jgi:hypothetical protein
LSGEDDLADLNGPAASSLFATSRIVKPSVNTSSIHQDLLAPDAAWIRNVE